MSDELVGTILVIGAYLSGSFPTASAVGAMSGHDHSKEGSGNPGASNVYRTSGAAYGLLTVVIDSLKGFMPVLVTLLVLDRSWASAAWVAATVGHIFPLARWKSGGKGVATAGGGALLLFPLLSLALILLWAAVIKITKTASIASLAITAGLVSGAVALHEGRIEVAAAVAVGLLILLRHSGNIRRLLSGDELHVG